MPGMVRTHVRRGRLGAIAVALSVAIGIGFLGGRASASGTHPAPAHVVVVHSGDTVWTIARGAVGPSADPRPMVQRIVARNHLADGVITAGERLVVPAA